MTSAISIKQSELASKARSDCRLRLTEFRKRKAASGLKCSYLTLSAKAHSHLLELKSNLRLNNISEVVSHCIIEHASSRPEYKNRTPLDPIGIKKATIYLDQNALDLINDKSGYVAGWHLLSAIIESYYDEVISGQN